jgi:hypothetical protein
VILYVVIFMLLWNLKAYALLLLATYQQSSEVGLEAATLTRKSNKPGSSINKD